MLNNQHQKGRLVLVDGSSYIYRAFYGLPPLKTAKDEHSGAVYGVVSMFKKLRKELSSEDYIVVVLDSPTPTFRHLLYKEYKANRLAMPLELQSQIPAIKEIIQAMGFPLLIHPGVEADDIIGTLSAKAKAAGMVTVISTSDKDFAQLVTDDIYLINTMTGRRLDYNGVVDRFGITPCQMVDYLALVGDTSDNVPGIPLVGPKTAVKWLKQYRSLDNLLDQADSVKGKVGENLRTYKERALMARTLITIKQDVVLEESLEEVLAVKPVDQKKLLYWFERLEFKEWRQDLQKTITPIRDNFTQHDLILDQKALDYWLKQILTSHYLAIDLETTSLNVLDAEIVGIALGVSPQKVAYIPLKHDYLGAPIQLECRTVLDQLKPFLEDTQLKKIGHNLKYDQSVLANYDIHLTGIYTDTLLEAYLLNSTNKRNDLDTLALEHLHYQTASFESIAGKGKQALTFNQITLDKAAPYAAEDVSVCLALHELFEPQLIERQQCTLRDTVEIPLISVLSRMERKGVRVNAHLLNQHNQELQKKLSWLEKETHALAKEEFNLGSPLQLQAILYDKHHLPVLAKTATGQPSTSEKVLQRLAVDHPLPKLILEYRTLSKLKSTYTDALPKQIHPKTNRVHTSYHQALVATGRLSSSNPNLQNIPVRIDEGRRIRRAFEATPGYQLLSADYSQIELRIMAHFSEDTTLLHALRQGEDIHTATAAGLFDSHLNDVTPEQRRRAKAINFGLMYGMSAFGLASQLNTTPEMAKEIVTQYFERYPGVKQYMENTRHLAKKQGYVTTLLGRQLFLPSITSANRHHQKAAERAAINAPLQGTAADIIKRAMIAIDDDLKAKHIDATMIMQVHDELVFEVKEDALSIAKQCIERGMQEAATLQVPLCVTIGIGNNWDEAH